MDCGSSFVLWLGVEGLTNSGRNLSLSPVQYLSISSQVHLTFMKFQTLLTTFFVAGALSASASFSVDFTGFNLSSPVNFSNEDPLVITVAEFGNVLFSTVDPDGNGPQTSPVGSITDVFAEPSATISETQPIVINFISGSVVENVMLTFIGADNFSQTVAGEVVNGDSVVATLPSNLDGDFGLSLVTFDRVGPKVPEPSVSILGAIGALLLLRRRR